MWVTFSEGLFFSKKRTPHQVVSSAGLSSLYTQSFEDQDIEHVSLRLTSVKQENPQGAAALGID